MRAVATVVALAALAVPPPAVACTGFEASVTEAQIADLKAGRPVSLQPRWQWSDEVFHTSSVPDGWEEPELYDPARENSERDPVAEATLALDTALNEPLLFASADLTLPTSKQAAPLPIPDWAEEKKRKVVQLACDGSLLTDPSLL